MRLHCKERADATITDPKKCVTRVAGIMGGALSFDNPPNMGFTYPKTG